MNTKKTAYKKFVRAFTIYFLFTNFFFKSFFLIYKTQVFICNKKLKLKINFINEYNEIVSINKKKTI